MGFKLLASFVLLFSLLVQLPSYAVAAPAITVDFCSSGFQVTVTPTTGGVIYVSTGFYALEPMNAGECIPMYDPPTQRDHFYLVNSSGAYHIGWYYGYGHQNKTLSRLLARVKRSVLPVTGKLDGNYVVFSFNSSTYRVPVRELSPYLWDTELLDSLVAFPYGKGIVIVPSVEVDVVENNFTVIKKPGERVGTTLLDFNFTYLLSYRYPRYLNGTVGGRFLWKNSSRKTEPITYDELSRMFDEPFYAFYFDGSILRPYPLVGIEILPELREFQLSVKYRFENLARPYELPSVSTTGQSSTASSTNTHFKPLSSTDNSNTYHGSGNVGGRNHLWPLLLVVILSFVLAKLLTSRRH